MSAGEPSLRSRPTGSGTVWGLGPPRGLSGPPGLFEAFWVPRAPSGSLWVSRGPPGPPGPLGGLRGFRGPPKLLGVPRGLPGAFEGSRGLSVAGYQSSLLGHFLFRSVIGLCQQVHRSVHVFGREVIVWDKFRIQCLRTGVAFVFCCTYHESIHVSVSWRIIDDAHVTLSQR